MVFKKLSKKIMAYTLTTAMMTGFFAVSNINLTTAWATAAVTDIQSEDDDVVLNTATGNTVTASGTLAHNISVDGSINAEIEIGSYTLTMGATNTITTGASQSIIIKQNGTTKYTIGASTVLTGVKISAEGITGGTITNGLIVGGTVKESKLEGTISLGAASTTTTLQKCKVAQSSAATLSAVDAEANTVVVKDSLTGSTEHNATLQSAAASNTDFFQFDNATLSGKFVANSVSANNPILKGSIKASGLYLSGAVVDGSDAVITLKDGINVIDASTASNNFDDLTLVRGADFSGASCKATIALGNTDVSGRSAKIIKYSSTDEANFADGMLKGNIVVTSAHVTSTTLDQLDANGYGAHLQGGYLTYGVYDFDYSKSGQKVDVTCVAKGNKYDGTKFSVTVKPNVEVGIAEIDATTGDAACSPEFSETLLNLSAEAKAVKADKEGLWAAFKINCLSNACHFEGTGNHANGHDPQVGDTYTVKFMKEGSAAAGATVAKTVDTNLTGTIAKKDISKAVVNGLHANGIDSYDTDNDTENSNIAKLLPDGFVSVELGANVGTGNVLTAGTQTAFANGGLVSTAANTTVYLVYKTEDGKLKHTNLDAVKGSDLTWQATSGKYTQNVAPASTTVYTGSFSFQYEIVDTIVDSVEYNGNARTASVSGAQSYSVNGGAWTTDAPSFTDAGTYSFNYKESDGVAKTATFTIKPATVTPVWNINSSGNAIEYDYDGKAKTRTVVNVSGSLTQSVLDKFDTSAVTYKYYYGTDDTKEEVKECVDATEQGKTYIVVPVADRNANKNFKFSTTSNPTGKIVINKVAAEVTSKKEAVVYYDGAVHSVNNVTVNAPEGSYKVLYGTSASACTSATAPTYREEGTYTVYYEVSSNASYDPTTKGKVNVTFTNTKGSLKLTIKPALTMKRSDSTKATVTYTGKYFPIKADAYCGDSKESDVKVVIYARKDNGKFAKVTDGIKDVGLYTFKYAFEIDGKETAQVAMDDTVTIKAAAKKSITKATTSVKNV